MQSLVGGTGANQGKVGGTFLVHAMSIGRSRRERGELIAKPSRV